ncbi:hypothetical protein BU567_00815 [Escherichia coli]|nr:hypothetical protein [Escherichia coli]
MNSNELLEAIRNEPDKGKQKKMLDQYLAECRKDQSTAKNFELEALPPRKIGTLTAYGCGLCKYVKEAPLILDERSGFNNYAYKLVENMCHFSGTAFKVLMKLAQASKTNGYCCMTQQQLAKEVGTDQGEISRVLKRLVRDQMIEYCKPVRNQGARVDKRQKGIMLTFH